MDTDSFRQSKIKCIIIIKMLLSKEDCVYAECNCEIHT